MAKNFDKYTDVKKTADFLKCRVEFFAPYCVFAHDNTTVQARGGGPLREVTKTKPNLPNKLDPDSVSRGQLCVLRTFVTKSDIFSKQRGKILLQWIAC